MSRVRTGNAALDGLLCDGFPAHSINVVMGPPGAGKTLLMQQIAFANLDDRRPVLYLGTLSEPMPKFLAHVQTLAFAQVERIGEALVYEDLGPPLAEAPERFPELMEELIRRHRPHLIIVDSLKAVADLMPEMPRWRRVLYQVAGLLSAYDTTSFWVGEYTPEMLSDLPELAVADGIVALARVQHGRHDQRLLRVVKLRGSGFVSGNHSFRLGRDGLSVYPRLVTPRTPPAYEVREERLGTGVPGLDQVIERGWLRGTSTLVAGPSGAGKTVLGLHFLRAGAQAQEPCLLVSFQENPTQLARTARSLGWDWASVYGAGIHHLYVSPVELQLDTLIPELFAHIDTHGTRRLVVDAVDDLAQATDDPRRFHDYLYALNQYLAGRGVTSMLLTETRRGGDPVPGYREVSNLSDNILLLELERDPEAVRTLRVVKSRGSPHDTRPRVIHIGAGGMTVT